MKWGGEMIKKISSKNLNKNLEKTLDKAVLNFNRKNIGQSRILFSKILEKEPTNLEANYYLGLIYSREDDFQKAIFHLKTVIDLNMNFLYKQQCRMVLGFIFFKRKEYERADYEFQEILKSRISIVQVFAALASIKYHLNDRESALEYARKAYDIDSYNLNAKNTYGFLLCEYEIDILKGLKLLREVVRMKPSNFSYLDSLGWGYFKSGDKKTAITNLKKAFNISKNREIKIHLDMVLKAS